MKEIVNEQMNRAITGPSNQIYADENFIQPQTQN